MKRYTFTLGILAQFLQYGSALLVLPFILVYLDSEEVGLWFVFMTLLALTMLVDFGFQPTIARNFALAYSGVYELREYGVSESTRSGPNYKLIAKVLKSARIIYMIISVAVFTLLVFIGTLYVESIVAKSITLDFKDIEFIWYGFALTVSLNIYFLWISPFLIGSDNVHKNYIYIIINKASFTILTIIFLIYDYGFSGVVYSLFISVIISRLAAIFLYKSEILPLRRYRLQVGDVRLLLKTMWPTASRMGLVTLSSFLVTRYNLLLVSFFFGLKVAAVYGLTLQVLMTLVKVAQLLFQINLPELVKARVDKNKKRLGDIYLKASSYYFFIFLLGVIVVSIFGDFMLGLMGSDTLLLEPTLFFLLALIFMLEGNHSNAALVITTGNKIPFTTSAVVSGLMVALFSTFAVYSGLDLIFLLLSQGLVQLAYNNWKWPMYVLKEIKV